MLTSIFDKKILIIDSQIYEIYINILIYTYKKDKTSIINKKIRKKVKKRDK